MSELKTPYLDNEIGEIELWVTLNPNVSKSSEAKLAEYQQIKAALKRLESLENAAQAILNNWHDGDGKIRVADLMNDLKNTLE